MEQLEHKSIVTKPHDLTYSYYLSPDFAAKQDPKISTLLLCHGFPDDASMWAHVVPILVELSYPFLLVEILGLGGSSKPTDPSRYNYRQQADSIAQILDKESVHNNVIPIGHDWGSGICQRFYLYNKSRCVGLILLSLCYQIPSSEPFDLVTANVQTTKRFGYPQWEYWNFFTAPDAPEIIEMNIDHFYEVMHGVYLSDKPADEQKDIWMHKMFNEPEGMRQYLTSTGKYAGFTVDLHAYAQNEDLRNKLQNRWRKDGLAGPVCYYHALKNNTMLDDERAIVSSPNGSKIEVPHLYIGMTGDWVCRTDLSKDAVDAGLVDELEEKVVDAHHWCLYDPEKAKKIGELISDWLVKHFPVDQ